MRDLVSIAAVALWGSGANAAPCDYRVSEMFGSNAAVGMTAGTASVALTGASFKAAGFYLITNGTTGATMIGSTMAGASGAGTVGIIGGTGTGGGAVMSVVAAPVVVAVAGTLAVAAIGMEGVCYYMDERVTDMPTVLYLMQQVSLDANPSDFLLLGADGADPVIIVRDKDGVAQTYHVSDLYLVNGELFNRDWFANTNIGSFVLTELPKQ